MVDTDGRSLEVFALREGAWVEIGALGGDGDVRTPPFEAVGFPLRALWTDDGAPPGDAQPG